MTKYEKFGLNAIARLVDPITGAATTLQVSTTDGFPTDGNFRLTIGREILLVTAVTGNTFTVVRGVEGSTSAPHDAGTPVQQSITEGAIESALLQSVPIARDSARPMLNTLVNSSGTALTLTDFTWVNQGGATAADLDGGGISLVDGATSATDNLRILKRTAPAAPYKITAAFVPQLHDNSNCSMGIGFRRNSNGYTTNINTIRQDSLSVLEFTSPTVFGSNLVAKKTWWMGRHIQWMQIEDNNTDLFYRLSMDGVNWQTNHQHGRAAQHNLLVPDEVFFFVNGLSTTYSVSMALIAWEES
jgi:hypothetical protein